MGVETLLITGLALTAAGTGYTAYNQYQAGKSEQALHNYNAQVQEQAALDAARDGRIAANAQRRQNDRIKARQRALFAKAGVNLASGSPLLVQQLQAGELELSALEIEQQSEAQAARARAQAVADRMGGSIARKAGKRNAFGTILQGAGQIASTGAQISAYRGVK